MIHPPTAWIRLTWSFKLGQGRYRRDDGQIQYTRQLWRDDWQACAQTQTVMNLSILIQDSSVSPPPPYSGFALSNELPQSGDRSPLDSLRPPL